MARKHVCVCACVRVCVLVCVCVRVFVQVCVTHTQTQEQKHPRDLAKTSTHTHQTQDTVSNAQFSRQTPYPSKSLLLLLLCRRLWRRRSPHPNNTLPQPQFPVYQRLDKSGEYPSEALRFCVCRWVKEWRGREQCMRCRLCRCRG